MDVKTKPQNMSPAQESKFMISLYVRNAVPDFLFKV
jgi:hypothetical protein